MYKRDIAGIIKSRLLENRRFMQVVTGPRQVGKTTAITQILQDLHLPLTMRRQVCLRLPACIGSLSSGTCWMHQDWLTKYGLPAKFESEMDSA